MAREKICGIYKIENLVNGKVYVGQTIDLHKRKLEHFAILRRDGHCNMHLQSAFNKYGEDNFKFSVLEICAPENCDAREIYWIEQLRATDDKCGYNLADGGSSGGGKSVFKPVICLSTNQIFRSVVDAAEQYEVVPETIRSACLGKYANGMRSKLYKQPTFWMYYDKYVKLSEIDKSKLLCDLLNRRQKSLDKISTVQAIPVVLLNTREEFQSISDAADKYGLDISALSRCCKHQHHSSGEDPSTHERLCWVFKDEYVTLTEEKIESLLYTAQHPPKRNPEGSWRKVVLLHPFEIFDSISRAAEKYNLTVTHICTCCRGKRNYAGFHPETKMKLHWMYYDEYLEAKPNGNEIVA